MKSSTYQNTFKAGYLRRQISSMFDIWSNEYYHLDGSTLLQFRDEKQIKPELLIDLRAYVIDGPWNQELNYIFTLRDVRDEDSLMLLGTFSYSESIEWVQCLRRAIAMSELQELFNEPTDSQLINNSARQIRLPIEHGIQEKIPGIIWNLIQDAQNGLQDSNWSLLKRNSGVSFFSAKNNKNIFKTNLQLDCKFSALKHQFRHQENEAKLNLFCTFSSTLLRINENYQLVETISQFNYKGKTYDIRMYYYRYIIETANYILIVKQSIEPNKLGQFKIRNQTKNTIHLLIKNSLSYLYSLDNCCYIQSFIEINPDRQHFALFQKFLKEQMICLGQISSEFQLEQEQILKEPSLKNVLNLQLLIQTIKVQDTLLEQDMISIHSLKVILEKSKIGDQLSDGNEIYLKPISDGKFDDRISMKSNGFVPNTKQQDDNDNKYLIPNDREGYQDLNQDEDHPAFKFQDMHNRIAHLTQQELSVFDEFKAQLQSLRLNDNTLLRYLQARNFKIKDAQQMLTRTIQWRKENEISQRSYDDYPQFISEDLHIILGLDKWGHPIIYTNAQNSHPEKFSDPDTQPITQLLKFFLQFNRYAFIEKACSKMRNNVDSYLVIIDCYNLSMKNFSFQAFKRQLEEVFLYYPERQYRNYILNSDFLTQTIYRLLKPFLPKRTIEKITFVGKNFKDIREQLLKDIDLETIPMRYGGGNPLVQ